MSGTAAYLLKATLVVTAVSAAVAWPVRVWAGEPGLTAVGIAGGICLAGTALGRLPHLFFRQGPDAIFHAAMAGMGLRLLGTLAIAAPVMLFSGLPLVPFALGLVVAYFSLLVLEVRDLVVSGRAAPGNDDAVRADGVPTP